MNLPTFRILGLLLFQVPLWLSAQNVGIGTASPDAKLHILGDIQIEDGTQQNGYYLRSDANGKASWAPAPSGVAGRVLDDGTVEAGPVTATQTGTGTYQVAFTTPFTLDPTVTVTAMQVVSGGGCGVTPCGVAPAQTSYCAPSWINGCSAIGYRYELGSFTTTGGSTNITDNGNTCSSGAYQPSAQKVTVNPGASFNFSIGIIGTNPFDTDGQYAKIWIDFNQDGVYDDPSELVFNSGVASFTHSGSITIPCSALCGETNMRVMVENDDAGFTPCSSERLGEVHDYKVEINAPGGVGAGVCNIVGYSPAGFEVECYDFSGSAQDMSFSFRASE